MIDGQIISPVRMHGPLTPPCPQGRIHPTERDKTSVASVSGTLSILSISNLESIKHGVAEH